MRAPQPDATLSQRGSVLPASAQHCGDLFGMTLEPRNSYRQPELPFSHLV